MERQSVVFGVAFLVLFYLTLSLCDDLSCRHATGCMCSDWYVSCNDVGLPADVIEKLTYAERRRARKLSLHRVGLREMPKLTRGQWPRLKVSLI